MTTSYYLGGTLVAQRENTTLRYTHQDHLSGTSLMTDTNGNSLGTMKYYPYGSTRSGSVPTDELFTGQKLDGTGLYYYGARYYDPVIGRFISPDTIIPNPADPQSFNRYSYCLNNPLKYIDPSGHDVTINDVNIRDMRVLMENPEYYMMVVGSGSYVEEVASATDPLLYQAYESFKWDNPENYAKAYTMETSRDHIVNIVRNDSINPMAHTTPVGNDYTLSLHPNLFSPRFAGEQEKWRMAIEGQVDNRILITDSVHVGEMVNYGLIGAFFDRYFPFQKELNTIDRTVQGENPLTVATEEYIIHPIIDSIRGPIINAGCWGAESHNRFLKWAAEYGYEWR